MLHLRESLLLLALLVLSQTFHKANPIPLSKTTERHILPETREPHPSSESKPVEPNPLEPNTLVHGVPNDFILAPSETAEPLLDIYENRFGLWPSNDTTPAKTVLLNNGKAKSHAIFKLILREGEDLKGMRHRSNDTAIISSFAESRERNVRHVVTYNITLTHHFMGTVGIAEYELTIFTTQGATLRVAGVYYVSGVVIYASTDSKPLRKVSGTTTSPLAVDSLNSLSNVIKYGLVSLPFKFQQVGPDVTLEPASFLDVLSKTKITVESQSSDIMPAVINDDARYCEAFDKNLSIRQHNRFDWENCNIRFDYVSKSLLLRLHPARYGKARIDISLPLLRTKQEVFRTEIRLEIMKPAIKIPELVIKKDVHFQLDYYGTESFSLPVKNMKASDSRREVLSYIMDLPGNRYATADFTSSSLRGPFQNISFTVVSPGQEVKALQEKIRHGLQVQAQSHGGDRDRAAGLVDIRIMENGRNRSHREDAKNQISSLDFTHYSLYNRFDYSQELLITPISRTLEPTHEYMSHVFAIFPGFDELITVEIPSGSMLWTSFASKKAAIADSSSVRSDFQQLLVKLILLRYTSSTFSQHKSTQISKYLSEEISIFSRSNIQPAKLVLLEDKGINIEATYHVLVSQEYTEAVLDLNKLKKNISTSIAKKVLLKDSRLQISSIMRLAMPSEVLGGPTRMNRTKSEEESVRYRGASGALVGVIVAVAVTIAISLVFFCAGYILARRYRRRYTEEDSSSPHGDSRPEAFRKDGKVKPSREDHQAATDVLRDSYGRAEDDSYESFKVRTELTKQGYFGGDVGNENSKYVQTSSPSSKV